MTKDELVEKIKALNKERLNYFDEQVKKLEDDSLEYLADDKIVSGNRHVTDRIRLRDLKCEWVCGALPNHILFRLSVNDNSSSVDIDYLEQVMKDRGYNSIVLDYEDYGYVFERTIGLIDKKKELKPQIDMLAKEYAIFNSEQCMYSESKGWETDYDTIYKAFIAGYKAGSS